MTRTRERVLSGEGISKKNKTHRVTFTDSFNSIASHKKCIFLNVTAEIFLKN